MVYGAPWCADCKRSQRLLDRSGVRYRWIDIDEDHDAAGEVVRINHGLRVIPTIVFPDGSILVEPSDPELAAKLAG